MRWLRRLSVCVLAATFALSGVAASACVEKPAPTASSAAASAAIAHDHHAVPAAHTDHRHHGDLAAVDAEHDQAPVPDHAHAGLKCCSMCTATSAMPNLAATVAMFAPRAVIIIGPLQRDLVGSIQSVDPGIPKRIV